MDATKRCPFCAEEIQAVAVRCKHCQADVTTTPKAEATTRALVPIVQLLFGLALLLPAILFVKHCQDDADRAKLDREQQQTK